MRLRIILSGLLILLFTIQGTYANNLSAEFNTLLSEKSNELTKQQPEKISYVIIFFYEGSCQHCQHFSPVIKAFSNEVKIPVYAFTVDGQVLPDWPNAVQANQSILHSFFGDSAVVVPAVFLVNVNTLHTVLVSTGEMNLSDFETAVESAMDK